MVSNWIFSFIYGFSILLIGSFAPIFGNIISAHLFTLIPIWFSDLRKLSIKLCIYATWFTVLILRHGCGRTLALRSSKVGMRDHGAVRLIRVESGNIDCISHIFFNCWLRLYSEERRGFKNVKIFLHLRPSVQNQLKPIV